MSSTAGEDVEDMGSADPNPLRNGCDDIWTWDRREKSPEVRLHGPGLRIAHFHPNWSSGTAGVRGTKVLNNGRYFWELHLSRRIFGTSMMFGIGTKKARLHADSFTNLLGKDNQGWGLSHKGLLWHSGRWTHYTKPFRENVPTKIGILFDGIAGTVTYYKDEKCLGIAFRGLNEIKEPLYPVICSTAAKTEMLLDSMKRDFVNLQDRCRAVIIKRVKNKEDLEKLFLPPQVRRYLSEGIPEIAQPFKPVNINKEDTDL
ncbi:SPRY domain-containing SOCS box protein 3 [Diorhabda carinulata]|uniref:SPRY domain-containing SOCS box protein 3 n=1 Tax=Diorhabda sublineata TaxID=1163346 RepID=UPI0024E065A2|nr:SPRY domain-containing SOCS box protein 3 [Diorhabda sublineata]XP_057672423.1 SPRY domain-containing SOCS box protein 3 [Diorhabda carinulata]